MKPNTAVSRKISFLRLLPVSGRSKLFLGVALLSVGAIGLSSVLPVIFVFPFFLIAVHFLLVRLFQKPINYLLQLTRQGGFDLTGPAPTVHGRDEFARLARGIYAMANRMRDSIVEARDQTSRLDEIFNAIGEGVIIVDSQARIVKINHTASRWTGWYGNSLNRRLTEVVRSVELGEAVMRMAEKSQHIQDERLLEPAIIEALSLEGPEAKVVRAKIVAHYRDKKNFVFIIFLFDVSDLHKGQEIRREFFANVSHELKTPIAAIRGYAETLADMPAVRGDANAEKFVSIVLRNSLELTKLIDEMLTLAGLESGALPLNIRPYDLRVALERVKETVGPRAKEASVELLFDIPAEFALLEVDAQRFDSVLLNLVDNGIKYNRVGGFVKISARQTQSQFFIYIEDNGQGIPDSARLRAFERFYRVDKAHSRLGGGSGLGLAIVKHTVQAHGGNIVLRSELGIGTVFTIELPRSSSRLKKIESVTPL